MCNAKKNYTDIDFALRYTQKNLNSDLGVFVAQESDESFTKEKTFMLSDPKLKWIMIYWLFFYTCC